MKTTLFLIVLKNLGLPLAHFIGRPLGVNFILLILTVLDFCWKVAHGVVLTAQRLISFGLHVSQCGPVLESLSHLLFACPLAQSVLPWLQSLMFRYSPMSPVLLLRHVLFEFNLDELRILPRVFVYILNVCKFCIWLARNDFRFRSLQPVAIPVIESVKARVKIPFNRLFQTSKDCAPSSFPHWSLGGQWCHCVFCWW